MDTIELQDLGQTATDAMEKMETTAQVITESKIDEILGTMDDPPLTLRELSGLDKAMRTQRGELTNNLGKVSELDDHIALEKRKLDEVTNEGVDEFPDAPRRGVFAHPG